jgi:glutathione S-transferase
MECSVMGERLRFVARLLEGEAMSEEAKKIFRERLGSRFAHVDKHLADNQYLVDKDFSVADAYLFVVSNWARGRHGSVVVCQRSRLAQAHPRAPGCAGRFEGRRAHRVVPIGVSNN